MILKPGYSWVSEDAEAAPDGAAKGMLSLDWTLDFEGYGGKGSMGRWRLKVRNEVEMGWEDTDMGIDEGEGYEPGWEGERYVE